MKKGLLVLIVLMMGAFSAAHASNANPIVIMETSVGNITIELFIKKAPASVKNFIGYASSGFYDNTIFHRVIKGFMIQGGGLTSEMQRKPARTPIGNEADNGLKNIVGSIAMARTSDPHSATSQFFINVADNHFLNHTAKTPQGWGYCVFGKVIAGMDVVSAIESMPTTVRAGRKDVPRSPILIKRVLIK